MKQIFRVIRRPAGQTIFLNEPNRLSESPLLSLNLANILAAPHWPMDSSLVPTGSLDLMASYLRIFHGTRLELVCSFAVHTLHNHCYARISLIRAIKLVKWEKIKHL